VSIDKTTNEAEGESGIIDDVKTIKNHMEEILRSGQSTDYRIFRLKELVNILTRKETFNLR